MGYEGILALMGLTLTASIIARALRIWIHSRWIHRNMYLRVLGDKRLLIGWRGEKPLLVVSLRLEVPRGKGRRPLLYEEVRVGGILRRGDEIIVLLNKSVNEYVEALKAMGRKAYAVLETSEGHAYLYLGDVNHPM